MKLKKLVLALTVMAVAAATAAVVSVSHAEEQPWRGPVTDFASACAAGSMWENTAKCQEFRNKPGSPPSDEGHWVTNTGEHMNQKRAQALFNKGIAHWMKLNVGWVQFDSKDVSWTQAKGVWQATIKEGAKAVSTGAGVPENYVFHATHRDRDRGFWFWLAALGTYVLYSFVG